MLAYHFYTLSKPVSPDSVVRVNGQQNYCKFCAWKLKLTIFNNKIR